MKAKNNDDYLLFTKEQFDAELKKAYADGFEEGKKSAQTANAAKKAENKSEIKVDGKTKQFRATVAQKTEDSDE